MHCEKVAVTDMSFRQIAVTEFLVKEGNSAGVIYDRLRGVYGDACMGASSVRRWVKYFKDGNMDTADQPRCGRPRTAATGRNKQKVRRAHQTRLKDNSEIAALLGVGHRAVQEMGSPFTYRYRGTQNGWKLLSYPFYSPDFAPSGYQSFGSLKDDLRGHHYETEQYAPESLAKLVARSWNALLPRMHL
jgi:transposase